MSIPGKEETTPFHCFPPAMSGGAISCSLENGSALSREWTHSLDKAARESLHRPGSFHSAAPCARLRVFSGSHFFSTEAGGIAVECDQQANGPNDVCGVVAAVEIAGNAAAGIFTLAMNSWSLFPNSLLECTQAPFLPWRACSYASITASCSGVSIEPGRLARTWWMASLAELPCATR